MVARFGSMTVGVTGLTTCRGMSPAELARACEERGFETLHVPDHSHIPASRRSPFPGASASRPELPDVYWHLNGVISSMAMAVAATERLVVGSSVALLCQHDPIQLAKELATIDHHGGGGRLEVGVGFGWNREEMEAHGTDWTTRRERVRDAVAIMRSLWTEHPSEHRGEVLNLEPSWSFPKTVGPRGLPILLGGELKPKMLSHLVEWADGWMPILTPAMDLAHEIAMLRETFERAGRDPSDISTTVMNAPKDEGGLAAMSELGVDRAALTIWSETRDDVLHDLDRLSSLVQPR